MSDNEEPEAPEETEEPKDAEFPKFYILPSRDARKEKRIALTAFLIGAALMNLIYLIFSIKKELR